MTLSDQVAARAQRVLTELVAQVTARVPAAWGRVEQHRSLVAAAPAPSTLVQPHNVVRTIVCASFLRSVRDNTLDLCVTIDRQPRVTAVTADLLRGGSGEILSECTLEISSAADLQAAWPTLEQFLLAQADTITTDLEAAGGGAV